LTKAHQNKQKTQFLAFLMPRGRSPFESKEWSLFHLKRKHFLEHYLFKFDIKRFKIKKKIPIT